jgi:hypothetical protein
VQSVEAVCGPSFLWPKASPVSVKAITRADADRIW